MRREIEGFEGKWKRENGVSRSVKAATDKMGWTNTMV